MSSPTSPNLILTERQALVALAQVFRAVGLMDGSEVGVELDAAIAVAAGGLVTSGPPAYTAGTLAPISLTPGGALRVTAENPSVRWFGHNPWAGTVRWRR